MNDPEGKVDDFDQYASTYDEALAKGISVSGESKLYFAQKRIEWLARTLGPAALDIREILDFGCGTGSSIPYFYETFHPARVVGVDSSEASLTVARQAHGPRGALFQTPATFKPRASFDLVFCNGVFHHIPPAQRRGALEYIHDALRPGGWFAFWENNPLNPGTRLVMSRIPFDRDAITLLPWKSRKLLESNGFRVFGVNFLFIFPRALSFFRKMEPVLARFPLGAQYQVLCRRT